MFNGSVFRLEVAYLIALVLCLYSLTLDVIFQNERLKCLTSESVYHLQTNLEVKRNVGAESKMATFLVVVC